MKVQSAVLAMAVAVGMISGACSAGGGNLTGAGGSSSGNAGAGGSTGAGGGCPGGSPCRDAITRTAWPL